MVYEDLLARPVSGELAVQLRNRHMALIDHDEEISREEIDQCEWALSSRASIEVAAVILHAGTYARLGQHLEIMLGSSPQTLSLKKLAFRLEG